MSIATSLRRSLFVAVVFIFCLSMIAQDSPAPQSGSSGQQQPSDSKDKKKDKNKSDDAFDTADFSEAVANNVLNDIRDGLEGHSQRLMLSAFDGDKMDGYLSFEDQIQAFFEKYEGFRVHIRIIQTSLEASKGIALAEFEMEAMPRGGGPALRRTSQLRFELERGKKGWKVVDFRPRPFFS